MQSASNTLQIVRRCFGIGLVVLACGLAFSAAAQDRSEKLRRFESDRQACRSGTFGQDLESCMREARAVRAERPGSSPVISPAQLQRNSMLRCEPLTGDDRTACEARMRGEGTVSGSVAGGGILRELVTTEVTPSAPERPASASEPVQL